MLTELDIFKLFDLNRHCYKQIKHFCTTYIIHMNFRDFLN